MVSVNDMREGTARRCVRVGVDGRKCVLMRVMMMMERARDLRRVV